MSARFPDTWLVMKFMANNGYAFSNKWESCFIIESGQVFVASPYKTGIFR
jgi:hypothetical protein